MILEPESNDENRNGGDAAPTAVNKTESAPQPEDATHAPSTAETDAPRSNAEEELKAEAAVDEPTIANKSSEEAEVGPGDLPNAGEAEHPAQDEEDAVSEYPEGANTGEGEHDEQEQVNGDVECAEDDYEDAEEYAEAEDDEQEEEYEGNEEYPDEGDGVENVANRLLDESAALAVNEGTNADRQKPDDLENPVDVTDGEEHEGADFPDENGNEESKEEPHTPETLNGEDPAVDDTHGELPSSVPLGKRSREESSEDRRTRLKGSSD
jgi:hypothetical protein